MKELNLSVLTILFLGWTRLRAFPIEIIFVCGEKSLVRNLLNRWHCGIRQTPPSSLPWAQQPFSISPLFPQLIHSDFELAFVRIVVRMKMHREQLSFFLDFIPAFSKVASRNEEFLFSTPLNFPSPPSADYFGSLVGDICTLRVIVKCFISIKLQRGNPRNSTTPGLKVHVIPSVA